MVSLAQGPSGHSTAQLSAEFTKTLSWHELKELVSAHAGSMELVHVEQSLQQLQRPEHTQLDSEERCGLLSRLLGIAVSRLDGAPATISRICWALAKLQMQFSDDEFLSIQQWIEASARGMESVDISYLLTGYAQLWLRHGAEATPYTSHSSSMCIACDCDN